MSLRRRLSVRASRGRQLARVIVQVFAAALALMAPAFIENFESTVNAVPFKAAKKFRFARVCVDADSAAAFFNSIFELTEKVVAAEIDAVFANRTSLLRTSIWDAVATTHPVLHARNFLQNEHGAFESRVKYSARRLFDGVDQLLDFGRHLALVGKCDHVKSVGRRNRKDCDF